MVKILFPDTYRKIQQAKTAGLTAEQTWNAMQKGVRSSGMSPACQAVSTATYWRYLVEIFGAGAAAKIQDPFAEKEGAE